MILVKIRASTGSLILVSPLFGVYACVRVEYFYGYIVYYLQRLKKVPVSRKVGPNESLTRGILVIMVRFHTASLCSFDPSEKALYQT